MTPSHDTNFSHVNLNDQVLGAPKVIMTIKSEEGSNNPTSDVVKTTTSQSPTIIKIPWGKKKLINTTRVETPNPNQRSGQDVGQSNNQTTRSGLVLNLEPTLDFELPSLASFGSDARLMNTEMDLPNRIEASYTDDFNILEVHELIMKRFTLLQGQKITQLEESIKSEQQKLNVPQTLVEKKAILATLDKLKKELDRYKSDQDRQEYLSQVGKLIDTYKEIGTTTKIISFKTGITNWTNKKGSSGSVSWVSNKTKSQDWSNQKGSSGSIQETEEQKKIRHATITQYLEIARRYIQIDVIREIPITNNCPNCGIDLTNLIIDEESGIQTCPNCGNEKYTLFRTPIFTEGQKQNNRNGYDDRDNFYKALMRYQGKQPNRIRDDLTSILDNYFRLFGLPTSEEVKKMPLTEKGTRGDTSRELIYRALSETGNATYYEDVNLICHLYWGWTLPDVSHLEDQIMDDYDKTQKVYESLPKNRKSNLNTQYRLFKHLQLRGHTCYIDDFKMVKTREILEYHDATWELMTTGAGLRFTQTI